MSGLQAKTVRIHGSDLFAEWLPSSLQEDTDPMSPSFQFFLTGSYGGLIALQKGYADACIYLQSAPTLPTLPEGYESTILGYYVLYLYAPESFPANEISKEAIAAIASTNPSVTALTWQKILPQPAHWKDQTTKLIVDSGEQRIAESLFRSDIMNGVAVNDRVQFATSQDTLRSWVNESDFFLLFSTQPTAPSPKLKPVSLINFGDEVGFPATLENIAYGDYSASYPILFYAPKTADWVKSLLATLASPALVEAFTEHQLLPNPKIEKK